VLCGEQSLLQVYLGVRYKDAGKKFMSLNLPFLIGILVDFTPLEFIPGIDPSIVDAYQIQSGVIFRFVVLAGIGMYIFVKIVLHEIRSIFNELEIKMPEVGSYIGEAAKTGGRMINHALRCQYTPGVGSVD
jgi:hypothetical protein